MDLAEIRERNQLACGPTTEQVEWLCCEVERLQSYESAVKQDAAYQRAYDDGQAFQRQQSQSSLTLSREEGRREGMERAAEIAETRMVGKGRGGEFYAHGVGVGECIAAAIRSEAKGERQ